MRPRGRASRPERRATGFVVVRSHGSLSARDALVAVALVSRARSQKAKALVRTEPSDAAIWLLPALTRSLTLGREPT